MALVAELKNRKTIYVYKPQNCSLYQIQSQYHLDREIDDFFIDRHNRLYPIIDNSIYALRNEFVLIASNFYEYRAIDSDYGCLFFWTQGIETRSDEGKGNKCVLMCRDVGEDIEGVKELKEYEHENYKLMVISRKNYILYFENNVHIKFKERSTKIELLFKIIDSCYLEDRLIFLDDAYNVQIFNLSEMRVWSGFKSIGVAYSIVASKFANLVALSTENGVFCIDIRNRSIIKKKQKEEMAFTYTQLRFLDRRTLLLIGDGIVEFNLADNNLYAVVEPKRDGFFKHFYESQGYILNVEFENKTACQCKCYDIILSLKLEMRRELYELNKEIRELKHEHELLKKER